MNTLLDQNQPLSSESQVLSTLDGINAAILARKAQPTDVSKMPIVKHEASGIVFRVTPMKRDKYKGYQNLLSFEDRQYEEGGGRANKAPKDTDQSDKYLLTNAVRTHAGEALPEDVVQWLLSEEGFGPSTYRLCEAAASANPPRQQLVNEIAKLWGAANANVVLWRVLKEMGLLNLLHDYISGRDEEKLTAARDLKRFEESLEFWEATLGVHEAAKNAGYETYGAPLGDF